MKTKRKTFLALIGSSAAALLFGGWASSKAVTRQTASEAKASEPLAPKPSKSVARSDERFF